MTLMRAYVTIEGRHACFQTTPFDDDAITWMRALEIKFLLSPAERVVVKSTPAWRLDMFRT